MAKRKKKFDVDALLNSIKPNQIVLYNDKFNTFDWVITSLIEILEHNYYQAEQCANIVHSNGKCVVKEGDMNELIVLSQKLADKGLKVEVR